jgi:hypothetical protein
MVRVFVGGVYPCAAQQKRGRDVTDGTAGVRLVGAADCSFDGLIAHRTVLSMSLIFGLATIWFQNNRVLRGHPARSDSLVSRIIGSGFASWFYVYKAILPIKLMAIIRSGRSTPRAGSHTYRYCFSLLVSLPSI